MAYNIQFLLKFSLLFTLLFTACIGAIRAQRYDDADVRAFLTPPEGCPMPCFMGIRPGVTTADEAVAILERHVWVGQIETSEATGLGRTVQNIDWYWNGRAPSLLNDPQQPRQFIRAEDRIVRYVMLWTNFALGDALMIFGSPERATIGGIIGTERPNLLTISSYRGLGLILNSYVACPTSLENLWDTPIVITLASPLENSISWTPVNDILSLVRHWNSVC